MTSFIENLKAVTDNINDIVFTQFAIVTEVNEDGTVSCKERETGTIHKNVINSTIYDLKVDNNVILAFVNNSIYDVFIVGVVGGEANIDLEGYVKCDYLTQNYPNNSYVDEHYAVKNHLHDDRYYTENEIDTLYYDKSEVDTLLSGKSGTEHLHDDRYYTESETDDLLNGKLDKEQGKVLSSNDYTDTDKNKLAGIESGANNYVHPATHPSSMITGLTANKNVITDSNGNLSTADKTIEIPDNSDLNDYTDFGFYYCTSQNIANCPLPANIGFYLIVETCMDDCKQTLTYSNNSTYIRQKTANTWTTWQMINMKDDTGWIPVSNFKSTYSHYTESDNLVVRRVGNTVELRGYWKTSSNKAASTSATVFATLPEGYAPSRLVYSVQRTGSGLNKYYILVNASGELAWSHYGNTSTATLESGTRMYTFFSWTV